MEIIIQKGNPRNIQYPNFLKFFKLKKLDGFIVETTK